MSSTPWSASSPSCRNTTSWTVNPNGAPTVNAGLQAAIAGNGSLLLPLAHDLFGEAAVDAQATLSTGQQIDDIPDDRFLRTLSRLFRPLPTINRLVPFGAGKALYGTTDVLRSTVQVQQAVDGTPYPTNFHSLRDGLAGPVVFPDAINVRLEGVSPVVALRSSAQAVALGLSEELLGDLNTDADSTDQLLSATDIATGETVDTLQAIAQVAASPARPVVAVVDDVVAFLQSEALSGNLDLNGDLQADDLVMRALKGAVRLNPNAMDTSADPLRAIDGSQLAISQGFVFFRTPEDATAPHTTLRVSDVGGTGGNDTSDQPSIDGLAEHVAYASRAGNLASGTSGAHRQILVTDLLSLIPMHTLVSAGPGGEGNADSSEPAISRDGDHVAFTSHATNLGATRVVWERGTNLRGVSGDGFALARFELAEGEEDVPGVDYSACTAVRPGIAFSFLDDGTVSGSLFAPDGPACQFEADFSGTYSVSPEGPVQAGSIVRVDAAVTPVSFLPPLDPSLSESALFFSATNIVTDLNGNGTFDFEGSFELSAATDENTVAQVYARTLGGGAPVELVSAALGGGGGSGDSGEPAPSGNGQLVAFASAASDLVASDSNNVADVFVRDLGSDTTERASVANDEAQANGASSGPAITADGSLVAFASLATNLVGAGADTNGASDVFLRDRGAGTTERASVPAPGGSANGASAAPDLSDDGRFVVFESAAQLVPDDTDTFVDIYLRDRVEGTTERVSVKSGGEAADAPSFDPSISGDGRFVVFASLANLVPGAPAGTKVYRRNRVTGSVELLSAGASAGDTSTSPDANGDGRTVAFDSDASLVMNDSLPVDVFVRTTGPGDDLNLDGDDADSVFQSFATDGTTPGLQPTARVAAAAASTGFGRALVSVPEADQGNSNLNATSLIANADANGDDDEADAVLHLFDGCIAAAREPRRRRDARRGLGHHALRARRRGPAERGGARRPERGQRPGARGGRRRHAAGIARQRVAHERRHRGDAGPHRGHGLRVHDGRGQRARVLRPRDRRSREQRPARDRHPGRSRSEPVDRVPRARECRAPGSERRPRPGGRGDARRRAERGAGGARRRRGAGRCHEPRSPGHRLHAAGLRGLQVRCGPAQRGRLVPRHRAWRDPRSHRLPPDQSVRL